MRGMGELFWVWIERVSSDGILLSRPFMGYLSFGYVLLVTLSVRYVVR